MCMTYNVLVHSVICVTYVSVGLFSVGTASVCVSQIWLEAAGSSSSTQYSSSSNVVLVVLGALRNKIERLRLDEVGPALCW